LRENLIARGGKFLFSDEEEEEGEEDELQDIEEGDMSVEFVEVSEGREDADEDAHKLADLLDKVSLAKS
jgi:hypothetical protein